MKSLAAIVLAVLVCGLVPQSANAQTAAPANPPAAAPASPDQKKPDYGQWWLIDPRDMETKAPGWLTFAKGQGSFANSTGSVSGFQVAAGVDVVNRKGLVTNMLSLSVNIQEQRLENDGGSFRQSTSKLNEMLIISVSKPVNVIGGVIVERDQPKLVDHRIAYFGGVSKRFSKGNHKAGAVAAAGYEVQDFLTVPNTKQNGFALYFENTYEAVIAQKGQFSHSFNTTIHTTSGAGSRLTWNVGLQMQLNPHIGIGPMFQLRYHSRPVESVQKTDTMLMFAVQVR